MAGLTFTNGQWYNSDGTQLGAGHSFVGGGLSGGASPTSTTFTPVVKGSLTAGDATYTTRRGISNNIAGRAFVDIEAAWAGHSGDGGMLISGLATPWSGAYTPAANEATGCPILVRRRIPNRTVNLATYGGVPGALAATIRTAIINAITALNNAGGGTLLIPPGVYDMGANAVGSYEFLGAHTNVKNVRVSGYGALFTFQTTAAVINYGIVFVDPTNVEVEGVQFRDSGYDSALSWKGAHAIMNYSVLATGGSKGFRVRDCYALNCLSLYASITDAAGLLQEVDIQGTADTCYYGAQLDGTNKVNINLTTIDARRSLIAYNCNQMTANIESNNTAAGVGSNGCVELASRAGDVCGNWKINVTYRGDVRHGTLVRVEHQGVAGSAGTMNNVDLTFTADNVTSSAFANDAIQFTHDAGGGTTNRIWSNWRVRGRFLGAWAAVGKVTNPQVSAAGSSIQLDTGLDTLAGKPAYWSAAPALAANPTRTNPQLQVTLLDGTSGQPSMADGVSVAAEVAENGTDIRIMANDGQRGGRFMADLPKTGLIKISGSYPV